VPVCPQCATENPDVAKFCLACGSPLAAAPPAHEYRKVVTIVFSDLKGSTAMGEKLDSESLREVMTRYFDSMSAELERHGGVVEKFIGDAIMAVFGLPKLHEDDALRAVRAAADMQRAQAKLNDELERQWGVRLTVRTGVNTGEVVAGDPVAGQRLVTGDAVNVAARLEQAAGEQEVLLGDLTYRLVRDYVEVEEVEPLELKGKSEPVPAYRLVGVREDAERPRRLDAPMVGRDRELEQLSRAMAEAVEARQCRLVTLVGEAGVGKSRLIDEFVRSVGSEVSFLRGRCLAYGEGITFWPLAEAVRQASGILERDSTESALAKLSALSGDAEAEARVASAIGLSPTQYPGDELFWGARKLFEALARPGPLLVLFEDVHWAEKTFLELIEHLREAVSDACLLIVCTTRHELIERQPDWSTSPGATRIELERLTEDETGAVAEHLLGMAGLDDRVRSRVVAAAEGNPLFVEQLISMLIDEGLILFEDGCWRAGPDIDRAVVPPTIQALLAARLDYLENDERAVIEPASVVGQVFVKDAVSYLVPDHVRDDLGPRLGALTDKQLVHPDLSRSLEEEAFRFHHVLIRDTAYDGILKRARASFHERFVEWGDSVNREGGTEYEEILGYHLEQAHQYLSELGPLDDHGHALAADGSHRLASAGRRALARGDMRAAANLLGRAAALLPELDQRRIELLPDLGEALMESGEFTAADEILRSAIDVAARLDDARAEAAAKLMLLLLRLRSSDPEKWSEEATAEIEQAITVFEQAVDHGGLAKAYRVLGWVHGTEGQFGEAAAAVERGLEHARLAGDVREEPAHATMYALAALLGPTPVSEAIERCEEILEQVTGNRRSEGFVICLLALLEAMRGHFERARMLAEQGRATLEELGEGGVLTAWPALYGSRVEFLAGDTEAAERELRRGYEILERMGERYYLSSVAGLLARVVCAQGRFDEAEELVATVERLAAEDDVEAQALWRCVRAWVFVRQGNTAEASTLAAQVVELLRPLDAPMYKIEAFIDLGEALHTAGDPLGTWALEEAARLSDQKGIVVTAEKARELLGALASRAGTT